MCYQLSQELDLILPALIGEALKLKVTCAADIVDFNRARAFARQLFMKFLHKDVQHSNLPPYLRSEASEENYKPTQTKADIL